jgi:lipopolysaccharide export system protein LptC
VVPELALQGVRFRLYRGEGLRLSGEAETLTFRRDTHDLAAARLSATVLEHGAEPARIAAPEGVGNASARTFTMRGGVTAERGGDVARTASASYAPTGPGAGLVTGTDPITVEGQGWRLEGTGFTLDPATGEMVVGGGARFVTGPARVR